MSFKNIIVGVDIGGINKSIQKIDIHFEIMLLYFKPLRFTYF